MIVKELMEKLKGCENYDVEIFTDIIYEDIALKTEEKQMEIGELVYFDKSLSEQKITFKFETYVDLKYHDLA